MLLASSEFIVRSQEYIDLYLIHDPLSGKAKRLETYKALLEAKESGKIRTVGVSNLCVVSTNKVNACMLTEKPSGVRHLEEIKEAGYEAPSVNQIEVRIHTFPEPSLSI